MKKHIFLLITLISGITYTAVEKIIEPAEKIDMLISDYKIKKDSLFKHNEMLKAKDLTKENKKKIKEIIKELFEKLEKNETKIIDDIKRNSKMLEEINKAFKKQRLNLRLKFYSKKARQDTKNISKMIKDNERIIKENKKRMKKIKSLKLNDKERALIKHLIKFF